MCPKLALARAEGDSGFNFGAGGSESNGVSKRAAVGAYERSCVLYKRDATGNVSTEGKQRGQRARLDDERAQEGRYESNAE